MEEFSRTINLLGSEVVSNYHNKTIAIFGIGGVGGFVLETLARSGIGHFVLIDSDDVSISNINRQIIATHSTIGCSKVEIAKKRVLDINPTCIVETHKTFVLNETINEFDFSKFDYVIDAVDTITAKLLIIQKCKEFNVPIISSMGTGNKLDPTKFKICDISKTHTCPLARVMRYELKKRNIKNVLVLFSEEQPLKQNSIIENDASIPSSVMFVPSIAGILIARYVLLDIAKTINTTN